MIHTYLSIVCGIAIGLLTSLYGLQSGNAL